MSRKYDHKTIEERWQKLWEEDGAFRSSPDPERKKYYVLEMFPYPSGKIHIGHVRNYSIGDVTARFLKKRGLNVFHPMGWDSFGLPAENAAIQKGVHPARWTRENIDNMRGQLKRMGLSYDWEREIATCDPEYYRWNQWFFLKMLEKGLAYRGRSSVNWCPDCATVLANEQVEDGRCWRCETEVEEKELDQWFLKITRYREELLDFTKKLPGWPERVLVSQRNWIGRSEGAAILFDVAGRDERIEVFTTRPDTLYGATFMSIAPESPLVKTLTTDGNIAGVSDFVKRFKREKATKDPGEMEKEGIFTGSYCVNPLTGLKMPIYVANFVLMEYGTGAVMAVPAHDQRDFEFAKKYDLPVKVVINPKGKELDPEAMEEAFVDDGVMIASGSFDGIKNTEAMGAITKLLEEEGLGKKEVTWRLRDWGISRQRYWGCPIPIVYCEGCGTVPVPEEELPVKLPDDVDFSFRSSFFSPLASSEKFVDANCPKCGGKARRETDTMDTFVDSSWYFLRYLSPHKEDAPFDKEDASYWMAVDQYIGGIEHAVMHLLYARFFTKVVRDLGLVNVDEPFTKLLTQGMVCKETENCPEHGYLSPDESEGGKCSECGAGTVKGRVEKMSKSKKNTIDPDHIIDRYGADTTRLFSLFAAPPERDLDWNEEGVEGSYRFLGRVWRLVTENEEALKGVSAYDWKGNDGSELSREAREQHRKTHETIQRVTRDVGERFHFNTAISSIMELVNSLYLFKGGTAGGGVGGGGLNTDISRAVFKEGVVAVLQTLSPFAPHLTEELWEAVGEVGRLYAHPWPEASPEAVKTAEVSIVVQINGKVRSTVSVPAGSREEDVESMAMADEKVVEWIDGKTVRKTIYVKGKLLNIVVS